MVLISVCVCVVFGLLVIGVFIDYWLFISDFQKEEFNDIDKYENYWFGLWCMCRVDGKYIL